MRVREGGEILDVLDVDLGCFACALGGEDGRTLFLLCADWPRAFTDEAARTGVVLTARAPAPRAGRP